AGGSLIVVIGPSGAGKSTLFDALTGRRLADRGTVLWDGRDFYANIEEFTDRIGVLPQESSPASTGSPRPEERMRRVGTALRQTVGFEQLTPRTALSHAARQRFSRDTGDAERGQRVN